MGGGADLMGTAEIAALLGVSRQRVLVLAKHRDFPAPLAVLSMGKVWRASDVRTWARGRPRSGTEPPGRKPAPSKQESGPG